MSNLVQDLSSLREELKTMFALVSMQFDDCFEYMHTSERNIAEKMSLREKNINARDTLIYRKCEEILALYCPVAIDLRFVLSSLRIDGELERIGDYLKGIIDLVESLKNPPSFELMEKFQTAKAIRIAKQMFEMARKSWEEESTSYLSEVMQLDKEINAIHRETPLIAEQTIRNNIEDVSHAIALTSVSRKIERIGDHIKNICEEVVFFIEAKIIRHREPGTQ